MPQERSVCAGDMAYFVLSSYPNGSVFVSGTLFLFIFSLLRRSCFLSFSVCFSMF